MKKRVKKITNEQILAEVRKRILSIETRYCRQQAYELLNEINTKLDDINETALRELQAWFEQLAVVPEYKFRCDTCISLLEKIELSNKQVVKST